jgi:hypothetical protein
MRTINSSSASSINSRVLLVVVSSLDAVLIVHAAIMTNPFLKLKGLSNCPSPP